MQTRHADEILLIDDMVGLPLMGEGVTVWHAPWRLGVGTAFNCGVSLAANDLVFLLCDDDWLEPTCLEECLASYEANARMDGFYWVVAEYGGELGGVSVNGRFETPCNYAMVTKGFWRETGGFPVEAVIAPDFIFLQLCDRLGLQDKVIPVAGPPLYHIRIHDGTETAHSMRVRSELRREFSGRSLTRQLRKYAIRRWSSPEKWGRVR
jgi:glycosyltransferase involved in cell wall biosynthesis